MKSRMPERARTDPWEPQGSNPLGPPGPELNRSGCQTSFLQVWVQVWVSDLVFGFRLDPCYDLMVFIGQLGTGSH